jgi:hypothetical protein
LVYKPNSQEKIYEILNIYYFVGTNCLHLTQLRNEIEKKQADAQNGPQTTNEKQKVFGRF